MHPLLTRRFALSAAAALLAPEVRAASPDRWTIVTEYPASAISGEGVAFFAATATGFSGGALDVQSQFDAPGGLRSAAMLEAVANGTVTAADAFAGALSGAAAIFQLSALPFLTRSATDTARLLSIARPSYEAALAARSLALLYATPWPPTGLWSRAPVSDATALQGLRVRTYDSASTAVLAAAGAKPAQISFADALPRLRAGATGEQNARSVRHDLARRQGGRCAVRRRLCSDLGGSRGASAAARRASSPSPRR